MNLKIEEWPPVPRKSRPLKIYVDYNVDFELTEKFREIGWQVVDVRLMAQESDAQRGEALKAKLEGVRQGTIEPNLPRLKFMELEARVYGLQNTKGPSDKPKDPVVKEEVSAKDLLSQINSTRAFKGTFKTGGFVVDNQIEEAEEVKDDGS